jgi:hypothetical protein
MDAVLCSSSIPSFASLSQSPLFEPQWSSTYAALQDGRIHRSKVMQNLVAHIPVTEQPLLITDSNLWKRPSAKTLADGGFHHNGEKGVSIGHSYSTLAWVPEASGSWAMPLRLELVPFPQCPPTRDGDHLYADHCPSPRPSVNAAGSFPSASP